MDLGQDVQVLIQLSFIELSEYRAIFQEKNLGEDGFSMEENYEGENQGGLGEREVSLNLPRKSYSCLKLSH